MNEKYKFSSTFWIAYPTEKENTLVTEKSKYANINWQNNPPSNLRVMMLQNKIPYLQ